jgi:hypothetical protein
MGFNRVLGRCRDTDVLLPLVYFLGTIKDIETWMIVGTAHIRVLVNAIKLVSVALL